MAQTLYEFKADLKGLQDLETKLQAARKELRGLTKETTDYKNK